MVRLRTIALGGVLLATAGSAEASPWTLPAGTVVVNGSYTYQSASREFFETGPSRSFPLRGEFTGTTYALGLRAGLTDRLEVEVGVPLRLVSYRSDPVLLLPRPAMSMESELDFYQRNVLDLSRVARGVGDLSLAVRWRTPLRLFPLAVELRTKIPTGYAGPAGTFGEQPTTIDDFQRDLLRYVRPENVMDDVTLGDGQLDVQPSLLAGYAFPTRTFLRLDLGMNLRFGGAAQQVVGAVRAGQQLGARVLVYAYAQAALSLNEGRIIGVSVAAVDPDLPADRYEGTNNLLLRTPRLERDTVDVGAGLILRVLPEAELNFGYGRTLWGRYTALVDSFSISLAVRAQVVRPGASP
ncbi:MAG: hypothetical protein HY909_20125 [Deltaproteobacteria bacterium]|nr:hypothetical protein [Deltaproteobacteria bacterium]